MFRGLELISFGIGIYITVMAQLAANTVAQIIRERNDNADLHKGRNEKKRFHQDGSDRSRSDNPE